MKDVVFLGQGKRSNILKFSYLQTEKFDLITLTYDKEIKQHDIEWEAIFAPGTTWAEGRNILLEKAKLKRKSGYRYYIFFDDDAEFVKGTFFEFANNVLDLKPDFAVPLSNIIKLSGRFTPDIETERPFAFDQIVQAYSYKAVKESIAIPYCTEYDDLSWWYSCEINQLLTLSFYSNSSIQFNNIELFNGHHYDKNDSYSTYNDSVLDPGFLKTIAQKIKKKYEKHEKIEELNKQIQLRFYRTWRQELKIELLRYITRSKNYLKVIFRQ